MRLPLADEGNDTVSEYVLGHLGWVRRRWNLSSMDLRLLYWYGDDDTTIAAVQTAPNESREGDLLSDVKVEAISTGRLHLYQPRENLAAINPTGSERSVFGTVGQSDDGRRGSYLLVSRGGSFTLDGGKLHEAIETVYDRAFQEASDDDYYDADEDRWEDSLTDAYRSYIGFLQGQGVADMTLAQSYAGSLRCVPLPSTQAPTKEGHRRRCGSPRREKAGAATARVDVQRFEDLSF
jgi:hypothetical protein